MNHFFIIGLEWLISCMSFVCMCIVTSLFMLQTVTYNNNLPWLKKFTYIIWKIMKLKPLWVKLHKMFYKNQFVWNVCWTLHHLFQFCHVGRLSHEVGWKYQTVVRSLESKRKVKAVLAIRKRDKLKKITKAASVKVAKQVKPFTEIINSYGYK